MRVWNVGKNAGKREQSEREWLAAEFHVTINSWKKLRYLCITESLGVSHVHEIFLVCKFAMDLKKIGSIITAMINEKISHDNLVGVQLIEYFFYRCDIFVSISNKISSDDRS